jgi:hypothetical protein
MRTGTKFWVTLATLALEVGMFVFMRLTGTMDSTVTLGFLTAIVATVTQFGVTNVIASGQGQATPTPLDKAPPAA